MLVVPVVWGLEVAEEVLAILLGGKGDMSPFGWRVEAAEFACRPVFLQEVVRSSSRRKREGSIARP